MPRGPGGCGLGPWLHGPFLTVGIGLGSWWAYYELGWGGWWYWDPVENASFYTVADGHRLIAFPHRRGKTRSLEKLDDPVGHHHVFH